MGIVCEWTGPEKRALSVRDTEARQSSLSSSSSSSLSTTPRVVPEEDYWHSWNHGGGVEIDEASVGLGVSLGNPRHALQNAGTGVVFGAGDMRFLQHFLLDAIPPLPIGGEEIWRGAARMAHDYDFLLHAMLGLGASHLELCSATTGAASSSQALGHRVKAIQALNARLSSPGLSKVDGDAAFAAMMALTFQASYMPEGMYDFISMVRGCHVVAMKAMPSFEDSAFRTFSREEHVYNFKQQLSTNGSSEGLGSVQGDARLGVLVGFIENLAALAPLCGSVLEVEYLAEIRRVIQLTLAESEDAYPTFTAIYNRFATMSHQEFVHFTSPDNHTAQLLLAHFFLLAYVIGMVGYRIEGDRDARLRERVTLSWLEKIARGLPGNLRRYMRWPLEFARKAVDKEDAGFRVAESQTWVGDVGGSLDLFSAA
ncbi:C6 zinc finger domain-containing protein [Colletotrichum truncatum]|uniref:C6 zinc finger domain-containing protein n=1 Tax=Colletotrichum truncatum TaxID=5467 RepID=A0ACC3ZCU3_COLTU